VVGSGVWLTICFYFKEGGKFANDSCEGGENF
jgi:hypothetical protein